MDRATLQRRLQETESLVKSVAENIAFQQQMIARLDRGGHEVRAARMFLRRLEAAHDKHVAARDRLIEKLTNQF